MTLFPEPLDSTQLARVRGSGYWSRTFVAFNDNEVIFRAQVAQDYTDAPFIEIEYENVDIGDYTDVMPGMVVLISPTTNPRDAVYRGRVADDPTADTLPVDLNATIVLTGYYLIVICDVELRARVRQGDKCDGRFFFPVFNMPPQTSGLPGCLVLYDKDDDGLVEYTPAQTGIPIADGRTIASYSWAIAGGGVSSISDPDVQNPDLTFQAGYHYLVRLRTIDSALIYQDRFMHVYAIDRVFSAPVVLPVVAGNISNTIEDGFNCALTAYGGVSNVLDRTHIAVFKIDRFYDNADTPIIGLLRFSGRLKSETITTEGSAEAGQIQQTSFAAEGITAYLQRLKVPNDIVRNIAAPTAYGEITAPDIYKMLVYFFGVYTTALSLGSFTAGDSNLAQWVYGGEPTGIDGGYALDVLTSLAGRVKAGISFAPDGSMHIEQLASFKQDRSGIETIVNFQLYHMTGYELALDSSDRIAQTIGFGGSFNSTSGQYVLYTATAPTVANSDAPETDETNRELLTADASTGAAIAELEQRVANDIAYTNPKPLLRLTLIDTFNWLFATSYQRVTATIPAASNTGGVAYDAATFWQIQSVDVTINPDGTDDVTAELVAETQGGGAQSIASQLPINLSGMNPVLPVLSDDPAFPDDPLWMYPTDTPTDAELQPIDPYSAMMSYSPFPPDAAAAAAANQSTVRCRAFQVLMRNSGTTNSPFLTVNTVPYTLKVSGYGQISDAAWLQDIDYKASDGGFVNINTNGVWVPGVGWQDTYVVLGSGYRGVAIKYVFGGSYVLTSVKLYFSFNPGVLDLTTGDSTLFIGQLPSPRLKDILPPTAPASPNTWSGSSILTEIELQLLCGIKAAPASDPGGSVTLTRAIITGIGINPFTMSPGTGKRFGDAWYTWSEGDEENAELFDSTSGLLLDGNKPALLPDFNPAHSYDQIAFTGTGNVIATNYSLADYSSVQNKAITIQVCRNP